MDTAPSTRIDPTPTQERASRKWRDARTGREAWARFRDWLARARPDHDGDAPWWAAKVYSSIDMWTGPGATRLVLFQKRQVMREFLPDGRGSDWATRWRIATATAPFAPRAHEVTLLRAHARLLGGSVGFIGDLDPHGLHTYGALRSAKLDAPDLNGQRLDVAWWGIDDEWLRRALRKEPLAVRFIQMGWVEREYWEVIKRIMPRVQDLIGEESFRLLETGRKAETDAFRDMMVSMLRSRLRRL